MSFIHLVPRAPLVKDNQHLPLPHSEPSDDMAKKVARVVSGELQASPMGSRAVLEPRAGSVWQSPTKKSPEARPAVLQPAEASTPRTAISKRLMCMALPAHLSDSQEDLNGNPKGFLLPPTPYKSLNDFPPIDEKSILKLPSASFKPAPLSRASSSRPESAAPLLHVTGSKASLHTRSASSKSKWSSISVYESQFFNVARQINPKISRPDFNRLFIVLSQVLHKLTEEDFLSQFIVKDIDAAKEKIHKSDVSFVRFNSTITSLIDILIDSGIQGPPKDKPRKFCFWTGLEAQKIANTDEYICDDKVPLISFLVECWKLVDKSDRLYKQMPYLFSLIYANLAKDDVVVYVSSTNSSGKAVLNSDSAFWVELNVLIKNPNVSSIQTFFIHQEAGKAQWHKPYDLKIVKLTECGDVVELSRRGDAASLGLPRISKIIASWQDAARPASAPPESSHRTSPGFLADLSLRLLKQKRLEEQSS